MITFSLQSGSNGNCIYVEAGGVRLLFDGGIPARRVRDRLLDYGKKIHEVHALIVSHDHHDHVSAVGAIHRLFHIPVYATRATTAACRAKLGALRKLEHFESGQPVRFDGVTVHTIPTPHDAADGVAFVVEHGSRRLGIFTDLGNPFRELREALATVDAAYLESNYDPQLLETGPYPEDLKRRIRGEHGHLSNEEASALLRGLCRRPRWVALAHLSDENNRPDLALHAARAAVGVDFPVLVARRDRASPLLHV